MAVLLLNAGCLMSQTATVILHIVKWSYDEQFSNMDRPAN